MFIYIVGVSKLTSTSPSTVRARVYQTKPEGAPAPQAHPFAFGGSEFTFQPSADTVADWTAKIGTYAEVTVNSFT